MLERNDPPAGPDSDRLPATRARRYDDGPRRGVPQDVAVDPYGADWDDLRYRLGRNRADVKARHQDWDVADVVEVVQEWEEVAVAGSLDRFVERVDRIARASAASVRLPERVQAPVTVSSRSDPLCYADEHLSLET